MYLQDTAGSRRSSGLNERSAESAQTLLRKDLAMRAGIALLLASGAVLGAINVLVTIHLVAILLGG